MIGKEVKCVEPVTLAEVAGILEKRLKDAEKQREADKKAGITTTVSMPVEGSTEGQMVEEEKPLMGLEQRSTLEYAQKFSHLGKKKAEEMKAALMKISKMKQETAVKIIDLLSDDKDRLKLLFAKDHVTASDKDLDEVIAIVAEYKKK